jgi:hypothetical protein
MKKQKGMSTVGAALIAAGLAGGAMAALALWQYQGLLHVRAELAEAQSQIQTANASAKAARMQLDAVRKELDERKLDLDQMRAERDSARTLLEAERQHTERIHTELNLAREQLAVLSRRPSGAPYPAPQVVRPQVIRIAPASGGGAIGHGVMAPPPAER